MNITPMARLKSSTDQLRKTLDRFITKEYTLNKSAPKYNPHGGDYYLCGSTSKGVENEFLRIFQTGSGKSFAFVFNNIEESLDRVIVSVTLKTNDSFFQRNFSFEEFKTKLKDLNKTLIILQEIKSLNEDSFYVTLSKTFKINEKINEDKEVKKIITEIKKEISKNKSAITRIKKKKEKFDLTGATDLRDIKKQITFLKRSLKYKKIKDDYDKARKEFMIADKIVKDKERELNKEFDIEDKQNQSRSLTSKILELEKSNKNILRTMIAPFSKKIQEKIKLSLKTV